MDYQAILDDVAAEVASLPRSGEVANYIPELANVNADYFGMAVHCVGGETFGVGDCDVRFSVQSMAKVLSLSMALALDEDEVWRRVGVEPSGSPFNSLIQLENESGIPRNPFINAGALVVADILLRFEDPKAEMLAFVRGLAGIETLGFDLGVALSEWGRADRNRALTHFMRSFGNIKHDVESVLDFYVHECSLAMSCREVAQTYNYLASDEACGGRSGLSANQVRRINALMLTCGFYDEAGEFAFRVGLPGKSGVGGGIVAVCPDRFTVAAWSPRLGVKGNSLLATEALRLFAQRSDSSVF